MKIHISDTQSDLKIDHTSVENLVRCAFLYKQIKTDEISIYFVSKKEIGELHDEFFDDPSPTDCITFPIDPPDSDETPHILGEVFVCPQVAVEFAKKNSLDVYEELSLYVVHGFLHLIGFDDIEPEDALEMRRQESEVMASIKEKTLVIH